MLAGLSEFGAGRSLSLGSPEVLVAGHRIRDLRGSSGWAAILQLALTARRTRRHSGRAARCAAVPLCRCVLWW